MIDGAELRRYGGVRAALGWQPVESVLIEPSAQLLFRARGGASYVDGATSGDNFDFHAPGLVAGLQAQLPWRVLGSLDYSFSRSIYANPDPRAVPAFVTNRRDSTHSVALQVSRPVLYDNVAAYLRLSYIDNASNIAVFDYDQAVVVGGMVVRF